MRKKDKFYPIDKKKILQSFDESQLSQALQQMLLIRNFEIRAESAYQQGKIGGFFHSYIGQEAVQTAASMAMGKDNLWVTSYRCHSLALLLGATPNEIMAALYGKKTGNAMGRGGSMHLFTSKLLGGHGIVGGQIPIGIGAGFSIKYKQDISQASICFMGDGAVAQGSFHESLNIASLWDLPCIFVIENNQWGMGTAVNKAISVDYIAEKKAPGYNMEGFSLDGMDFFHCYGAFKELYNKVLKTQRPILIEVFTDRFKGHSVSDPGLYRSKESLSKSMERDPLELLKQDVIHHGITEEQIQIWNKDAKKLVKEAMTYADESPEPELASLEEDVFV